MIGVFGGTFDPVHFGHLRPALEVFEALGLREMRMVPVHQPAHRGEPLASPKQRETLLRAALGNDTPGLVVDSRELRREGPSYMVDTLRSLREDKRDGVGDEPLCLVLGMDAFLQLPTWHCWRELLELAHLVVTHRPGWALDTATETAMDAELAELWRTRQVEQASQLEQAAAGSILHLAVTQLDISATRIRELIAAGNSPRFLLPDAVWNLIRLQGLYDVQQHAPKPFTDTVKDEETD
jgi:nicotinate-nucleotide adenylyltransferase